MQRRRRSQGNFGDAAHLGFAILDTMPDSDINKGPLMVSSARRFVQCGGQSAPGH
jgi:hypothetical protein